MDISKSLQATLHYYEHVANRETDERAAAIVRQTQKLRKIITRIENELESESELCCFAARLNDRYIFYPAIQTQKEELKEQLARIFEGPELRDHRVRHFCSYIHTAKQTYVSVMYSTTSGSSSCTTACTDAITSTRT